MAQGSSGSLSVFLPEAAINTGKSLFAQLMDCLPWTTFTRIAEQYGGKRYAPHQYFSPIRIVIRK
ncbi:MAG: hypothetical protein Q8K74_02945 [Candidatus Nitrotoga sp.]|nr:hypothetical protein [Candidatus Nitrotoga sp.]MDP1854993.1 hypothetical protein [Candidatus Nitrotoga sp.]